MIKTDYKFVDDEPVVMEGEEGYGVDSMADLDALLADKDDDEKDDEDDDDDDSDDSDDSDDETDDEPGDDQDDDQDDDAADDEEDEEESDDDKSKDKKQSKKKTDGKDHKAFAAMRAQNSQLTNDVTILKDQLKQLAMGLGLQTDNEADMMEQLGQAALRGRAKQEKKTPEQIAKDNATQKELLTLRAEDVKRHTFAEISEIKKFGASDDEIRNLVQELVNEGKNPFQSKLELKAMYISRNYETIMERERAEAVEKALKRDDAANKHGSKSKKKGKKDAGKHTIDTMDELNKALDNL